jgi:hypothetical protein
LKLSACTANTGLVKLGSEPEGFDSSAHHSWPRATMDCALARI